MIQGVAGFGSAIVMMGVLSYFIAVTPAAAITSATSIFLNALLAYRYRASINRRAIVGPVVCFIGGGTAAIMFMSGFDSRTLKMAFGIFLVALAVFCLFFGDRVKLKANWPTMLACGLFSGICEGLFSIGGPLMALFFLSITHSKQEYLGTLATYFLTVGLYNMVLRVIRSIMTVDLLPYVAAAVVAMVVGLVVGNRITSRIDEDKLKKLTYGMIGVSGIVTVVSCL